MASVKFISDHGSINVIKISVHKSTLIAPMKLCYKFIFLHFIQLLRKSYLQGHLPYSTHTSTLKMEEIISFETLITIYQSLPCHVAEDM
jgi:hypothetical protein